MVTILNILRLQKSGNLLHQSQTKDQTKKQEIFGLSIKNLQKKMLSELILSIHTLQ